MPRISWRRNLILLAMLFAPQPAAAQTFFCANCGTEWTQLANYLQLVDQLAKQASILQTNISQYNTMVYNTTGLRQQAFGNALADLKAIDAILARATALAYSSSSLNSAFAQKYSTYQDYQRTALSGATVEQKYQQWSQEANSSALTTLRAAGLQSQQMEGGEDALIKQLEGLSVSAGGHMQAIQVTNQISLQGLRQIQKLRQIMLIQLQLAANAAQRDADRAARQQAAWKQFTAPPAMQAGDGRRY